MAKQPATLIQELRTIALRSDGGIADADLLERFVQARDNSALEALVVRHAPMVWGVCRRLLFSHHDAEDAFQATFLVLVRKAHTVMPRAMVGNWLHGVAYQTALKGRAMAAKRKAREKVSAEVPDSSAPEARTSDLLARLDEAIQRLPKKYRAVIVLCELEGKTIKQTAQQLGVPEGTVAGWLSRARTMLGKRLKAHGPLSVAASAIAVPPTLLAATVRATGLLAAGQAAAGICSAKVAALMTLALKGMLLAKLKMPVIVLGFLATAISVAVWAGQPALESRLQPVFVNRLKPGLQHREAPENPLRAQNDELNQARYLHVDLGGVSMKFVRIEPGKFLMGSPDTDPRRFPDEFPQREVTITNPFYMGVFEVTQKEYQQVMGENPSEFRGESLPVENVSWIDAMAFCERLSKQQDKTFDLPTEAEWEYACRAGTSTLFSVGDTLTPGQANMSAADKKTKAVGSYAPNAFGLYDMHGNVWEWCKDWYRADYYTDGQSVDPPGPGQGKVRVLRGGSWGGDDWHCRSALRSNDPPDASTSRHGFRVVLR